MPDRDPQTYALIGAAMRVHSELGPDHLEAFYGDCLELELAASGIPYVREAALQVHYRGHVVRRPYRADFVCFDRVVVELKVIPAIGRREISQLANYLAISRTTVGLVVNFGQLELDFQRVISRRAKLPDLQLPTPAALYSDLRALEAVVARDGWARAGPSVATSATRDRPGDSA